MTFSPALSYKLTDNFSLGAHVGINYAKASVSNAVDFGTIGMRVLGTEQGAALGLSPQGNDGYADLEGDAWATNYGLGALYTYGEDNRNRIGISYRTKTAFDVNGDARFTVPEEVSFFTAIECFCKCTVSAHITMPEHVTLGKKYWINDRFGLQAEARLD
ncbi:MAG: OmpP1/FadL family transporter [Bdellovibrionota bacterium]